MGYRYIGAKTRVVAEVLNAISNITPRHSTVVDLMTGTGAVAYALRCAEYSVIANDLMTYSFHHARVQLLFSDMPTFDHLKFRDSGNNEQLFPLSRYESVVRWLNDTKPLQGYFWTEFSVDGKPKSGAKPRNYFSPENAMRIDGMRDKIRKIYKAGKISDLERSVLLHVLIMAANDSANIAGTYGHYLSKTISRSLQPIELKPVAIPVMNDAGRHTVLHGYAESVAKDITADICYIDPPYMKRQYAANYHILETLAREDKPVAVGESGLRPWRDQYSNFCTKTKIWDSFDQIISSMHCKNYLISYSEDGLIEKETLEKYFRKFGSVKVKEFINKRFRSNSSSLHPTLTEYLIHLKRR